MKGRRRVPRGDGQEPETRRDPDATAVDRRPREASAHPSVGREIGPYRLKRVLGEGGMGTVWLAEQSEPVRRLVALKLMRSTFVGDEGRARFLAERQALARLSHPGVCAMLEAGTTEEGHPYFVMELVDGERLDEACDERRLSVEERVRLAARVCDAVQHAHAKGILHRDLKPSNVLLTEVDGELVPKIIDFGIARALHGSLSDVPLETGTGLIGTPAYLSPEALSREKSGVDTRSDVYALGLILRVLLTGVQPFTEDSLTGASLVDLVRRICDGEAPGLEASMAGLPAADRERIAEDRGTDLRGLGRRLGGELEWIVARATAVDPEERYASASELAADLRRFLEGEAVEAGPPSPAYRLRKALRKHWKATAVTTLLLLSLVGGFVARSEQARRAQLALEDAEATLDFVTDLFARASPFTKQRADTTVGEVLDAGAQRVRSDFPEQPLVRASVMHAIASSYHHLGRHEDAKELLLEGLEIRRRELGPEHPSTLSTEHVLALCEKSLGRGDEAERTLRRLHSLAIDGDQLGLQQDVSRALAGLLLERGELDEAESLYRSNLALAEEQGRGGVGLGRALGGLAKVAAERGDHEEALRLAEQSLQTMRSTVAPDNYALAAAWDRVARYRRHQGDLEGGVRALREALAIREDSLGPLHRKLEADLLEISRIYLDLGQPENAVPSLEQVLEIARTRLKPDHPKLVQLENNLAIVLRESGRFGEAEARFRSVIERLEKRVGGESELLGDPLTDLGILLWRTGRLEEAQAVLDRALEVWLPHHGPDAILTSYPLWALGNVHRDAGRLERAEEYYLGARAIRDAKLGHGHPERLVLLKDHAELMRLQGRIGEAAELERSAGLDTSGPN